MPNTYTKQQFNRDLKELNNLINVYNGGAKKTTKKTTKKTKRTFHIVSVNGKTIPGGEGRYSGENHSSVKDRACNAACRKRGAKLLEIAIREQTRGSDNKVKVYECERTKRKNPIDVIGTKGKNKGKVLFTVGHNIKAVEIQK